MVGTNLRFAALARVSTEQQEKQGESLRTQKKQLMSAVGHLGGTIVEWYGGQEHATAGWEKKEIDRLLRDAQKNARPFDAVIVADPSRWSRDNRASETGLEQLKNNGIRFFVLTQEHDLFEPDARLYLSLSTVIAGYQAGKQKQKSLANRIERAKRGLPTCGKLPFGRTFNREAEQWGIDEEKRAIIEDVARRYLAGESLPDLAQEYGFNHSNLHKTLAKRCGSLWEQEFICPDLNIHEVVKTPVPRLLSDAAIKAIRQKMEANKTYQHGEPKHSYLLSGMVFCQHCGYAMFGQTNHGERRYYRHAHTERSKDCEVWPRPWVRCDELEDMVIRHLFDTFGNPQAVQRAIEEATPNLDKIREFQRRQEHIEESLAKIRAGRDKILGLIVKGAITEEQAEKQLDELRQLEAKHQEEALRLHDSLANVPNPTAIKAVSERVAASFKKYRLPNAKLVARLRHVDRSFEEMTWEDKRALAETVFSGYTPDGRPNGVYIETIDGQSHHRHKRWLFTLHGNVVDGDRLVVPSPLY